MTALLDRTFRCLTLAGGVITVAMLLLTAADVIGRNAFNYPLPGVYQLTELAVGCVIFLVLPQVTYERRHLCMGLLDRFLSSGPARRYFGALNSLLLAATFALVAWRLWDYAAKRAAFGETIGIFSLHTAPFYFAFSVLAATAAVASLLPRHTKQPHSPHTASDK